MANVFPTLSLSELMSQATQPRKPAPNPLLGLKLRPPAGGFQFEQPPAPAPDSAGAGPSTQAATLLDPPLPPVRPSDLGVGSLDGIADPSIVARQKGASPSGSGSAGGLTADDLKGLIQYQVGGVAQGGRNFAPIYTAGPVEHWIDNPGGFGAGNDTRIRVSADDPRLRPQQIGWGSPAGGSSSTGAQ